MKCESNLNNIKVSTNFTNGHELLMGEREKGRKGEKEKRRKGESAYAKNSKKNIATA